MSRKAWLCFSVQWMPPPCRKLPAPRETRPRASGESGFLLVGADALHVFQDRRAVRLPQRLEHAAALDARELLVVASNHEFCASGARGGGERPGARSPPWPPRRRSRQSFYPMPSARFRARSIRWRWCRRGNPSPRICCATSFVQARPITLCPRPRRRRGWRLTCGSCRCRPHPTVSQSLPRR